MGVLSLLCATIVIAPALAQEFMFSHHHITIVGENHKHVESPEWFLSSVSKYIQDNRCLNVALEISSDEQDIINEAMNEGAPVAAIRISSIIDHTGYRSMLSGFSRLIAAGNCLKVYAIDAPQNVHESRDEWMLKRIKELDDELIPWAVLIGKLHALKQVNWYPDVHGKPFLAELLQKDGYDVFSIIQDWTNQECTERSGKYVSDIREPLRHLLEPVAAHYPEAPSNVVDAAIIWNCQ